MSDVTRLPKWAQQELQRLRMEADEYRKQLDSTNVPMKEGDVGAWYWGGHVKRKCPDSEWMGYTGHGMEIDIVSRENNTLDVSFAALRGDEYVCIKPIAANVVRLVCIKRKSTNA